MNGEAPKERRRWHRVPEVGGEERDTKKEKVKERGWDTGGVTEDRELARGGRQGWMHGEGEGLRENEGSPEIAVPPRRAPPYPTPCPCPQGSFLPPNRLF